VSRGSLTTTSYAILGLLAIQPWSTYELARQMERSLGRIWPRAESKLYEEPKKLVAHGLAQASSELSGQRRRTVYAITPAGRQALAAWLKDPGQGPVLQFEQLLKVFFSENGTKQGTLASLVAAGRWAREQTAESLAVGRQYLAGEGPFPERQAQLYVTVRFIDDFYALVGEWARWATRVVEGWPDDPGAAQVDPAVFEETVGRLAAALETDGSDAPRQPRESHESAR
jgi:PadR family transcriptional regulator, regulatory protein AphA